MTSRNYWTDEQVETLCRMYAAGKSDETIALAVNRSRQAVLLKRKQLGLAVTHEDAIRRKLDANAEARAPLLAAVLAAYDAGGSIRGIARLLNLDHRTVSRWLRASGRDTTRGLAWARDGKKPADLSGIELPADPTSLKRVANEDVRHASGDLSDLYRGRRYDDVRLKPSRVARPMLPPTHVPTQTTLA